MLHRYSDVFRTLLGVVDLSWVALAWLAAYAIRFHAGVPTPLGTPPLTAYLYPLPLILPLFLVLFHAQGLYQARRMDSPLGEAGAVVRATALAILVMAAATFFEREHSYSRLAIGLFSLLAPAAVIAFRSVGPLLPAPGAPARLQSPLRADRRVGAPRRERRRADRRAARGGTPDPWRRRGRRARRIRSRARRLIGGYGDLKSILRAHRVDQLIIALSRHEAERFEKVVASLADEVVNVKIVPDLLHGYGLRSTVESLDGIPVIGLQETALVGWPAVAKRGFDLAVSAGGARPALARAGRNRAGDRV